MLVGAHGADTVERHPSWVARLTVETFQLDATSAKIKKEKTR